MVNVDGNNDFYMRIKGKTDPNDVNVSSADICTWDGDTNSAISGGGGIVYPSAEVVNVDHGWLFKGCDNIHVPRFHVDNLSATGLLFVNSESCHVGWAKATGGAEVVDCNGNNAHLSFGTLIGDNVGQEIIDLNSTRDTYIGLVKGLNTAGGSVKLGLAGAGGISSTNDNIIVDNIVGEYSGTCLLTSDGISKKNFTVNNMDIITDGEGVLLRADSAGEIDGADISGRAEVTNDNTEAIEIKGDSGGNGVSSQDIRLDVEVLAPSSSSGTKGLVINDCNDITGRIHAHDCPAQNIEIDGTSSDGWLVINDHDSGAGRSSRIGGDNFEIYGEVADTLRLDGDNNVVGPNIDSISNNGSGNVQVNTSSI